MLELVAAVAFAVLVVLAAALITFGVFLVAGWGWTAIVGGVLLAALTFFFLADWSEAKS